MGGWEEHVTVGRATAKPGSSTDWNLASADRRALVQKPWNGPVFFEALSMPKFLLSFVA
eukprot:CAMPEP_0118664606 /NCGR_PEP_ID=MMETSP0785-20121206/18113_1 /TAXON_ID=91992 /ORGANISM="Bolidomonas pacifica, Strain CCMP 1866" /LENGTH=58 /DNA_ID=CAMNT_0006558545 /DNA_START=20 /DNA_END=193 /DNA_ORIENTATION=+